MKLFSSLRQDGNTGRPKGRRLRLLDLVRSRDRAYDHDLVLDALAFRALLAESQDVLSVIGAEDLRWLRLSETAPRLFGVDVPASAVIGTTVQETYDPETARNATIDMARVIETGEPLLDVVCELRFPTGEIGWGAVSLIPLRDLEGTVIGLVGMNRDVTQQHWAERALESHKVRLETLFADSHADAVGGIRDVLQAACDRALKLTGATAAAVSLRTESGLNQEACLGAVALGELPEARDLGACALQSGRTERTNLVGEQPLELVCVPLRSRDRQAGVLQLCAPRFADGAIEAAEMLALTLAASVSSYAESAALERLRAIFETVSTGIVRLTLRGHPVEANPALATMLGYAYGAPRGKDFHGLFHPEERAHALALFRRLVEGELDNYQLQARLLRNSNFATPDPIWCEIRAAVERDEEGCPACVILVIDDITEQLEAQERLQQAQKLDGIGQLAAGVAHEFNNLLMGILGYAGLARDTTDVERAHELIDRLIVTGDRAATLTRQLLAYGRRQPLARCELDVNQTVLEMVAMLRPALDERIELVTELSEDLWPIQADPNQIQQLLLNLAVNARDAIANHGTLRISTANFEVVGDAEDAARPSPGRYVSISVVDTGCGMPAEVQARAFEPFFTTKRVGEGSGLGLSSVYGIVKQNAGEIEFRSTPGEGTAFDVYLPASAVSRDADLAEPELAGSTR